MDIQKEISIFRSIKDDFISAVHKGVVSKPNDLLPWLRSRLPEEDLKPDTEFGFTTAAEELAFVNRVLRRDAGAVARVKLAVERGDTEEVARLVNGFDQMGSADSVSATAEPPKYFNSFWSLMTFVDVSQMCTKPGCTTCGCMPFRKLIYSIGGYNIKKLITAVSEEDAERQDPECWYEPFRVIAFDFPDILKIDCPLVKRYKVLRDECLAEIERHRENSLRQQEEIHLQAVARKQDNRLAHEKRSQEARERYYRSLREEASVIQKSEKE